MSHWPGTQLPIPINKIVFEYAIVNIRHSITSDTTFELLEQYRILMNIGMTEFYQKNRIFPEACKTNNTNLAKTIKEKVYPCLTRRDYLGYEISELKIPDCLPYIFDIFTLQHPCVFDNLDLFCWLIKEFDITQEELNIKNGILFIISACSGSAKIFNYLRDHISISADRLHLTFIAVCERGHVEMCALLIEYFEKIESQMLIGLTRACSNNKINVAKYIESKMQHNLFSRKMYIESLQEICKTGNLEILQWYVESFKITPQEIRSTNKCYNNAIAQGDQEILTWIFKVAEYEEFAIDVLTSYRSIEKSFNL